MLVHLHTFLNQLNSNFVSHFGSFSLQILFPTAKKAFLKKLFKNNFGWKFCSLLSSILFVKNLFDHKTPWSWLWIHESLQYTLRKTPVISFGSVWQETLSEFIFKIKFFFRKKFLRGNFFRPDFSIFTYHLVFIHFSN